MEHTLALTRKLLEGMGIEDKQIETIIEAHSETVTALKAERDKAREAAAKVPDLQKQLEDAKKATEGGSDWQSKFDAEHQAFEDYKAQVAADKKAADTASAYRKQVLEKAGIAAQYMNDVMGVTKLDGIELDDDGNIKDADKLAEAAKEKWSSFVVKKKTENEPPANPPKGNGQTVEGADPEIAEYLRKRHEMRYGKAEEKD